MSYSNYGDSKSSYPISGQYSNNKHEYGGDMPYSGLYADSLLNLLQGSVPGGPASNPAEQQRLLLSILQQQASNVQHPPPYARGSYRDSDPHMVRGSGIPNNYSRGNQYNPRSDWNRPPQNFDFDRRYSGRIDQGLPPPREPYNKMRPSEGFRDKRMHEDFSMRSHDPFYDSASCGSMSYDPMYSRQMPPSRQMGGGPVPANCGAPSSSISSTSSSSSSKGGGGGGNRFSSRSDSNRSENKPIQTRKYTIKINVNLVNVPQWEFTEMKKRFSQLYLSDYVSRVILDWTRTMLTLRLDIKVPIRVASLPELPNMPQLQSTLNSHPEVIPGGVQYWIKIMLVSGLPYQSYDSLIRPQNSQLPKNAFNKDDSIVHLSQNIKFLVVRRQQCRLCAIGGLYDPEIDGSNYEDPITFERTAIRITKEQLDLDLSGCSKWNRFISIEYAREGSKVTDVSVYMIPTAWEVIPEPEVCSRLWKMKKLTKLQLTGQRQVEELSEKKSNLTEQLAAAQKKLNGGDSSEDPHVIQLGTQIANLDKQLVELCEQNASLGLDSITKTPPSEPHLLVTVRGAKLRECQYVPISLEGLLDYSFEGDREEEVMELSIFAEAFWNYLQYTFGMLIMSALESNLENHMVKSGLKTTVEKRRDGSSATVGSLGSGTSDTAPLSKKSKLDEEVKSDGVAAVDSSAKDEVSVQMEGGTLRVSSGIELEAGQTDLNDLTLPHDDQQLRHDGEREGSVLLLDEKKDDDKNFDDGDRTRAAEIETGAVAAGGERPEDKDSSASVSGTADTKSSKPTFTVSYHYHQNLNMPLLRAFHFFDRNRTGSLRAEDLEHLLYSLGAGLTRHYVTELILKADVVASSGRFEKKKKISFDHMVKQPQPHPQQLQ